MRPRLAAIVLAVAALGGCSGMFPTYRVTDHDSGRSYETKWVNEGWGKIRFTPIDSQQTVTLDSYTVERVDE